MLNKPIQSLPDCWQKALAPEFAKDYWPKLQAFVNHEYQTNTVYPKVSHVFRALHLTPLANVKVVIVGQDPYHGPGQANGLAFSVASGVATPPSLNNIFKELQQDIGCQWPEHGSLESWAKQGVLLLNTVLTVRQGEAFSHRGQGWEQFTGAVLEAVNRHNNAVVFILWGKGAQQYAKHLDSHKHCLLKAPHPSPLSAYRGFFGCQVFSKTNDYLTKAKLLPIDWCLQGNAEQ